MVKYFTYNILTSLTAADNKALSLCLIDEDGKYYDFVAHKFGGKKNVSILIYGNNRIPLKKIFDGTL